jgi:predicted GH43/DUF377 family glycosyl hydrolase
MRKLLLLVLLGLTACAPAAPAVSTTVPPPSPSAAPATPVPATATQPLPTDLPVTPSAAAPATSTGAFFEQAGEIVPHGPAGEWDGRYTDPGAVVYADGQFHMFRNGFQAWPAEVSVGYVTSADGLTWTEPSEDPVLDSEDVPYAGLAALASSVLVEPDGTWVLYFYTWESSAFNAAARIGRATAPAPTGPWTVDPEPVLTPGPAGAWDSAQVLAPDVTRDESGYVMYYSGNSGRSFQAIGRATSADGVHWTKSDDPATTDAQFAASDPVLVAGSADAWDEGWVHQPRVFLADTGWVMFYRGVPASGGQSMALGYATSTDGLTWTRSALNPVLKPSAVPGANAFWFTNVLYHAGTVYLFWEVGKGTGTSIYLATHTGPLPTP